MSETFEQRLARNPMIGDELEIIDAEIVEDDGEVWEEPIPIRNKKRCAACGGPNALPVDNHGARTSWLCRPCINGELPPDV